MREPKTRSPLYSVGDRPLPNIAVVVATLGRPDIVTAMLNHLLETQTVKPTAVIVSCVLHEDAGNTASLPAVRVVTGRPGSSAQRNAGLAALPTGIDVVVFFDDDFVADANWLAAAARTFRDEPEVVAFTGRVLADGVKGGPGLSFDDAVRILGAVDRPAPRSHIEPCSPYGCNMAFRLSAIGDLRFDERLVLYGWLEDRDFSAALAKRGGRLIKCASASGVHMGVKVGRVAGDRFGYSQVVNPIYMLRKGTMTVGQVASHLFRNITSNVTRALRPEPFIDRRGRLRGNLRGLADVLHGCLEPERAAAPGHDKALILDTGAVSGLDLGKLPATEDQKQPVVRHELELANLIGIPGRRTSSGPADTYAPRHQAGHMTAADQTVQRKKKCLP